MRNPDRFVYVDDDPLLSAVICGWAEREGMEAVGVAGIDGAMRCCAGKTSIVLLSADLVSADWGDIAEQLSNLNPIPRVLVFAKRFDEAFIYRARRAPITGVISRGAAAESEFAEAIEAIGKGHRWFGKSFDAAVEAYELSPRAFFKILSKQELILLHFFGLGLSDHIIARDHDISPQTVQTHRKRVMRKLGLHSAREFIGWALARGVVSPHDFPAAAEHRLSA